MAKHVFIFGAGASVPCGGPVMGDFLDAAQLLLAADKVGRAKESFENVFKAISDLQPVHSKSEFDLINLESVFTGFEMAKLLGRFPGRNAEAIDKLIDDLKVVIVKTLENEIKFPFSQGRVEGHPRFVSFLKVLAGRNLASAAILTFNYDLVFDVAFCHAGIGADYGLNENRAPETACGNHLPLLKLHGSLNWGAEKGTGKIFPWFVRNYISRLPVPSHSNILGVGSEIYNLRSDAQSGQLEDRPVLVPPSWNKADSHRSISAVWARAAKELSEADSIYVIGYSLPTTDTFFRQLFALGSVGPVLLKRFWVFDPDPSREGVFRSILGPGARSRFQFYQEGVDAALARFNPDFMETR